MQPVMDMLPGTLVGWGGRLREYSAGGAAGGMRLRGNATRTLRAGAYLERHAPQKEELLAGVRVEGRVIEV
eukprot:CAMPEP_0118883644 /NCGR_PEP_ID=MMETSP1163-20130328/22681_1 /TAXON_ID=124430 /ORGANISM="Phaeomonas parva, Strain CCMP2877" /LENGTH=70 /DNA_ID=CAMNT_0006821133 /DNA_START=42 /DNA_END=249 /DNA_ORIENTATION=-